MGFVLGGEQWWGCAERRREGTHLPAPAGEGTCRGGGVGWLAWRDPRSAPRFLLSEREESQRLTRAIGAVCVWSSCT